MAAALWMAVPDLHAIEDVPEGGLRWLQGYDGNAPTGGFRVDGRLRIEAPDEPQPVGLVLESGRLEIGPGGELLVQHGPGGSRFLQGDVVNDGLVSLNSVLLFSRDGAEWVNRGTIRAAMFMGLGVTGKGARFRQASGEIHSDEPGSRLEFYNQSWFIHGGGKVFGSPAIVASSARIEAAVTEDLRLRFLGPGCRLEGRYPADAVRGCFARLALPPLETGLHWQVVPSEREVRLVVRRSPAPLVIEWLHRDGGDLLRVSGPWGSQQEVVLRVSPDLKQWTPFQRLFPFAGVATVPVPRNPGGEDGPMTVYQAVLGPVGSTTW